MSRNGRAATQMLHYITYGRMKYLQFQEHKICLNLIFFIYILNCSEFCTFFSPFLALGQPFKFLSCLLLLFLSYLSFLSSYCFSGKGLTIVVSVIEGSFGQNAEKAETAKKLIMELLKKEKLKGFAEVIVSKDVSEGMSYLCVKFSSVN